MDDNRSRWLKERAALTLDLGKHSYSPHIYLQRATCQEKLGYPDLAASDAYRSLLLTDEALDEGGEHHREAVDAIANYQVQVRDVERTEDRIKDNFQIHLNSREKDPTSATQREPQHDAIAKDCALQSYKVLARSLLDCGDLQSAYDFTERALKASEDQSDFQTLQKKILERARFGGSYVGQPQNSADFNLRDDLPENGSIRREIYPWNQHEPDRYLEEHLIYMNEEIQRCAPKCKVQVTELPLLGEYDPRNGSMSCRVKQLGIFATSDIDAHEPVLLEPSILTSSTGLHESFCDACSTRLPPFSLESPLPSCPSCEDIFFCSKACLDRANDLYHPAICGISDYDVVAKDPSRFAATNALYTLLIARTMAMAETQAIHPLDLTEIKYLWGDYSHAEDSTEHTLPFSFANNIAQPLHLLARLDKDPFAPETLDRYDTWVINTLFAKFRGTANAKMNERTGTPEVAGVHWLWCLANHSCAPNVRWEWEKGSMGFVARGGEDVIRLGDGGSTDDCKGGIRAGEEVLNHYCDVRLPVKERREWAVGALGGICMCKRCIWEDRKDNEEQL